MKKSIITGTASVNVLLKDGNSILKEVDFVGKFSERKIVKKAIADLEEVCKAKVCLLYTSLLRLLTQT